MRVLITGAAGLLGSCLARHLTENGFSVRALLDPAQDTPSLEDPGIERASGVILDPESVLAALNGIQAVFHCDLADLFWPQRSASVRAHNVEGTRNLLVAMARAGVEDLVNVGSAFSFGAGTIEEPGTEETPYDGERFGLACLDSTHSAQELVLRFNETGRVRCVVVNPSLVIGAGAGHQGTFAELLEYVAAGNRTYPSGGINVVSAADVSRAALKAFGRGKAGRCYILGSENLTYHELFKKVAISLGVPVPARRASDANVLARGLAGSLSGRLTGKRPTLALGLSRLAVTPMYYSSDRSARELEFSPDPVDTAIDEACRSFAGR